MQKKNNNGEVAPVLWWDALRAVMRAKLIAKRAAIKKAKREIHEKERRESAQNRMTA